MHLHARIVPNATSPVFMQDYFSLNDTPPTEAQPTLTAKKSHEDDAQTSRQLFQQGTRAAADKSDAAPSTFQSPEASRSPIHHMHMQSSMMPLRSSPSQVLASAEEAEEPRMLQSCRVSLLIVP